MEITIPLKAFSINDAFKGRHYKTKDCKDYEEDFFKVAPRKEMIKGMVEIEYEFFMKNHASVDYDNLIKVTQDLLVKCGYLEDDRHIYKATIWKIPSKEDRMRITIGQLTHIGKGI